MGHVVRKFIYDKISTQAEPCKLGCLFLARIVSRVDVVDASRPDELHLDNRRLVSGPHIMRVFCRLGVEGTRLDHPALLFEFFAHTQPDPTADHGDGLGIRMSMWRN